MGIKLSVSNLTYTMNSQGVLAFVGSRNEKGFVNNLKRKGFTSLKSLQELIANSVDAGASNVVLKCWKDRNGDDFLDIIDDGHGMGIDEFKNMLDSDKENHTGQETIGVSGVGCKPSLARLSEDDFGYIHTTTIYSKKKGCPWVCAEIPWHDIFEQERWDGMSIVRLLTNSEEDIAYLRLQQCGKDGNATESGTIIRVHMNGQTYEQLSNQFSTKFKCDKKYGLKDWLGLVFGRSRSNIWLDKGQCEDAILLNKYNYLDGAEDDFLIGGVQTFSITVYRDIAGHLQWGVTSDKGKLMGFKTSTKNTSKEYKLLPKPVRVISKLTYKVGARKPKNFHQRSVSCLNVEDILSSYDVSMFETTDIYVQDLYENLSKHKLFRNGQCIDIWNIPDDRMDKIRTGNVQGMMEYLLLRGELSYDTHSSQKNEMDSVMCVQVNKTQTHDDYPRALERLLNYLRHQVFEEIWSRVISKESGENLGEPNIGIVKRLSDLKDRPNEVLDTVQQFFQDRNAMSCLTCLLRISESEYTKNGKLCMEIGMGRERDLCTALMFCLPNMIDLNVDNDCIEDLLIGGEKFSVKFLSNAFGNSPKAKWTSNLETAQDTIKSMVHQVRTGNHAPHMLIVYVDAKEKKFRVVGIASYVYEEVIRTLGYEAFKVINGNSRGIEYSRTTMNLLLSNSYFDETVDNVDLYGGPSPIDRRLDILRSMNYG